MICVIVASIIRSWRVGRCLEGFLEVGRFAVTEYGVVGSHGDPIHARSHGFRKFSDMCTQKGSLL